MSVLIKDNGVFRMTRLQAHKRYINTIKPIDDLLLYVEFLEVKDNERQRKL